MERGYIILRSQLSSVNLKVANISSKFISISHVIQDDKKRVTTYDLHDRGKDKVSHKKGKTGGKRKNKRKGERDYGYS